MNRGISLYVVQGLLGHASPRMTQRYAHLAPQTLLDAAETVSSVICDSRAGVSGITRPGLAKHSRAPDDPALTAVGARWSRLADFVRAGFVRVAQPPR